MGATAAMIRRQATAVVWAALQTSSADLAWSLHVAMLDVTMNESIEGGNVSDSVSGTLRKSYWCSLQWQCLLSLATRAHGHTGYTGSASCTVWLPGIQTVGVQLGRD